MRSSLGAGVLKAPGDADEDTTTCDYPDESNVRAGVVYANGSLRGNFISWPNNVDFTATLESGDFTALLESGDFEVTIVTGE